MRPAPRNNYERIHNLVSLLLLTSYKTDLESRISADRALEALKLLVSTEG